MGGRAEEGGFGVMRSGEGDLISFIVGFRPIGVFRMRMNMRSEKTCFGTREGLRLEADIVSIDTRLLGVFYRRWVIFLVDRNRAIRGMIGVRKSFEHSRHGADGS